MYYECKLISVGNLERTLDLMWGGVSDSENLK